MNRFASAAPRLRQNRHSQQCNDLLQTPAELLFLQAPAAPTCLHIGSAKRPSEWLADGSCCRTSSLQCHHSQALLALLLQLLLRFWGDLIAAATFSKAPSLHCLQVCSH